MNPNRTLSVLWSALFVSGAVLGLPALAHGQAPLPGGDINTVFGQVQLAANAWIPSIMSAATRLFFLLASIDFAWSVPTLLREHDFMGLFQGIIKRLLVVGFFYWVLQQGQTWIPAIVQSFVQIGSTATGLPMAMNATDIMAQGVQICSNLLTKTHNANLLTQFGAVVTTLFLVVIVFISYGIITLHYVVTKLESIIVMTAGYLFLGFGGSRWTMPYFERYIALAISTGTRLMLIYLMLGVFQTVSTQWESTMNAWTPDQPVGPMFAEVAAMLLFAFASWMIPKMAGSLASGSLGLGASDLFAVGGAYAAGAAAGVTTLAAVAASPFTAGGSLAAEAGMMGLEASALAEGATTMASGLSAVDAAAAPIMAGAAGVPANVPPPPADAQMDVGPSPAAPAPDSSASQTAPTPPAATAQNGTAPAASTSVIAQGAPPPESHSESVAQAAFERLESGQHLENGPASEALTAAHERGSIQNPEDNRRVVESSYKREDKGAEVQTAAATVISDATTTEARANDSVSAAQSGAGNDAANRSDKRERRQFPAVPDDGAAHVPPPQLRIDREE